MRFRQAGHEMLRHSSAESKGRLAASPAGRFDRFRATMVANESDVASTPLHCAQYATDFPSTDPTFN
jgi:hypothetical protein